MRTNIRRFLAVAASLVAVFGSSGWPQDPVGAAQDPGWPAVSHETRPWTRWWWMGSAVDRGGLASELESLKAVGLGGVEITPIYGVAGTESKFIPYLSDQWVDHLEHTLREAARLGLGVDMATGTGWPFGGPWVGADDAPRNLMYRTWTLQEGERLNEPVTLEQRALVRATGSQIYEVADAGSSAPASAAGPKPRPGSNIRIGDLREPIAATPNLQALALEQVRFPKPLPLSALMAYSRSRSGEIIDLTSRVSPTGMLDWVAPAGTWTIYGVFLGWHGKLVERAAPGGEGNVIDHFSREAIRRYLAHLDGAFRGRSVTGLRAFFNDSYEVDDAQGQADATPAFFEEFERRRGYDLRRRLPDLLEEPADDVSARVLADYRQTISDLLLSTFTAEWRRWADARGTIVRNQAHGSPANLLDLYAASDIPETEGEQLPRFKWATSAAHVAGRRLVSAEAATWLGEHFRVTLADVRTALDRFFVAGVNHIVYHGTAYSPQSDEWPGWQFYASVEFNSRNSWWTDFSALNAYVTRTQSFLQAGTPDHDVLVYYPFYESIAERGAARLAHFGGANPPARGTAFEEAAATLQGRGFTYDFISDSQLAATRVKGRELVTEGGGLYKTLLVPSSRFIPLETWERIVTLARDGAQVVAFRGLPADVAGLADLARRRARFTALRDGVALGTPDASGIREARVGRGTLVEGADIERLLSRAGVSRERLVDQELEFTRRRYGPGRAYFIVNSGSREVDGWVPLDDRSSNAVAFDPMTGRRGDVTTRRTPSGTLEVQLVLPRGASIVVATAAAPAGNPAPFFHANGTRTQVSGPWQVAFTAGGPALPSDQNVSDLSSWTRWGTEELKNFSGTARYTTTFRRPAGEARAWQLDLGRVHESARVRLNGSELGTLIGPPFEITFDAALLAAENVLEIHVSNLMANRIAAMDRTGVRWRKFYNVNFPARLSQNRGTDGLFSAASWEPLASGLIGPVTLTPMSVR